MVKIKKWKDKTKEEKKKFIIWNIIFFIFLIGTITVYVYSDFFYGEGSFFNQTIPGGSFVNAIFHAIPSIISSIQIIVLGIALDYLLKVIMRISFARTQKGITIVQIIESFLKWAIAIAVILLVLYVWGVDTTTLVASAGVLTLVIGLGAQSLIADIVAGVFIVFEGEYEVGDIIVLDGWRGTVVEIGIRTTKIEDAGGNVKIINNSEIKSVINRTKETSLAKCYMDIQYETDIDMVEAAIKKDLDKVSEQVPGILSPIEYKGVNEFGDGGVSLLFVARCKEKDLYQIQRDMNKYIRKMFQENGFDLAYTTYVVHTISDDKK